MKPFVFPLESLLRLKRQHEQMADLRLTIARTALEHAQADVTNLKKQLDRQAALAAQRSCREASSEEWTNVAEITGRLSEALHEAEYSVDRAQHDFNLASEERARCAIEVETLVTLKEKQRDEHMRIVARENQIRIEQLDQRRTSRQ
jgi:flagellar export protein FliJ